MLLDLWSPIVVLNFGKRGADLKAAVIIVLYRVLLAKHWTSMVLVPLLTWGMKCLVAKNCDGHC